MKKNYAYSFENNQPNWRQLYLAFCSFCLLLGLFLSNKAHAVAANTQTAGNTITIRNLSTAETGNILDCYTKEVKIVSHVTQNGITLSEIDGVKYSWTGPDGFTADSKDITVTVPGYYRLTASRDSDGYDVRTISVYGNGYVTSLAGSDKIMYPTDKTLKLGGYAYGINGQLPDIYTVSWEASNGGNIVSGANTLDPIVDAPGTYTITLTHFSGCTMTDTMEVRRAEDVFTARISNNLPELDCDRRPIKLYSYITFNRDVLQEGVAYSWTGPDNFVSDERDAIVTVAGTYTLEATHIATGMTSTASILVREQLFTSGSAGPDKKLTCDNPTVTLEGSITSNFGIPIWLASDGGNIVSGHSTLNPVVDAPGTYTLRIFYHKGCPSEYTVKVTHEDQLIVSATGGKLECTSAAVQLKAEANQEGVTYSWTGPNDFTSTEQNPTVQVAGDYKVTVTNPATGCTATTGAVVTPVAAELQVTNHMIDFNSEKRGLISSINTEAGPVAIMGRKRNANGSYEPENYAAIFDTQDPTGDDTNLYTVDWGHALIINQNHDDYPDANQWGGELILDFSAIGPVTMESLKVVGMDLYEQKSWVYLYDANGKELHKEYMKPLGMNSKQTINLGNTRGVMKMKVVLDGTNDMWQLSGSAAIDDIKFHVETMAENPCEAMAENITHAKAYPTSFSDHTKIEFIVRETENYSLNLYDTQGMLVAQLKEGTARAGELTTVEVNGRELKEGMYIARLMTASGAKTFRLILQR